MNYTRPNLSLVLSLVASFLFCFEADARSRSKSRTKSEWDKQAQECFQIFEEFDMVAKEQVAQCVALWATYNSGGTMRASQRFILVKAFNFLHEQGDSAQSWLAYNALLILGEAPEPKGASGESGGSGVQTASSSFAPPPTEEAPVVTSSRIFYDPPAASKKGHQRARKKNSAGAKQEKRKQWEAALELYEEAVQLSPRYETALYNTARMYGMFSRTESAVRYLANLRDLATEESAGYIHKARVDRAFRDARDASSFKSVTGYANIKLLNSKGMYGEDEIERIEEYFESAFFVVSDLGVDPHDREFPIIWHKDGVAKGTARILTKLVNHPRTVLVPIDWETEYDIVVTWGDAYDLDPRTGQPIVREYELKNPDDAREDALRQQDKALREPESVARDVDRAARTPERSVRRIENTGKVLERTGGTIQSGGGLIK